MGLVEDAGRYYEAMGLSPTRFNCPRLPDCKGGCEGFAQAREPYIGVGYELGTLPRLLFLSLDPGSIDDPDPNLRTMGCLREWEENRFLRDERDWWREGPHYCRHWHLTYEMALRLQRPFEPNLEISQVGPYFAHTNSAKCCMNNDHRREAVRRLFDNCRDFVSGELAVLQPDIFVTQGNWAKEVVTRSFRDVQGGRSSGDSAVVHIGGREVLWLRSYHPSCYGRFYKQVRECWDGWAADARQFMANRA